MAYKGKFTPINPTKYVGEVDNIVYRSLWERTVMKYFDQSTSILKWSSEELTVPYFFPDPKNKGHLKLHKYYPDFVILAKTPEGKNQVTMIEVKPQNQTVPPKVPKKKTRKYTNQCNTYAINVTKWAAASKFCLDRHWEFKILTEKNIYG